MAAAVRFSVLVRPRRP